MSEKSVSSLVIMTLPKNLDCLIGGKGVDPAGGRICAIFDDGDFKEIPMTNEEVSIECPTDKEGNSLATVFYGGVANVPGVCSQAGHPKVHHCNAAYEEQLPGR